MVSWGDIEYSSDDVSSLGTEGPNSMYDSDYCGRADDGPMPVLCKCKNVAMKHVAFEGCWTGRRFYACSGEDGETCDFIHWVDDVWPDTMCKAINKMWEMIENSKTDRINAALESIERGHELKDEIAKLKQDLKVAQDDLKQVVEEKQVTLALKAKAEQALIDARAELEQRKNLDASTSNMHKVLRIKAEKDYQEAKVEHRKLQNHIAALMKQNEGARLKLRKISVICDE